MQRPDTDTDTIDEPAAPGGLPQPAHAIITQDETQSHELHPEKSRRPAATRLSFLGVILLVAWWIWPRNSDLFSSASHSRVGAPQPNIRQAVSDLDSAPAAIAANLGQAITITVTQGSEELAPDPSDALSNTVGAPEILQIELPPAPAMATPVEEAAQGIFFDPLAPPSTNVAIVIVPTPTPTATPTEAPSGPASSLPQVRIIPAVGINLPPTRTPGPLRPGPTPTPTPEPLPIVAGRLWSTFTPLPAPENDHFWIDRPFLSSAPNQVSAPSYQFGSTGGNQYRIHHGMDMSNPAGTPVLAGATGEVIHAGPDDQQLLGPYNNFYGNAVVIKLDQKLPVGDGELDVYVLYGHLSQVNVALGQHVNPADVIGAVGMTGIAIGPHLHVEIRLGANTYRHSANPYLWVKPLGDTGAVAVRLLTADGRTWPTARLTLAKFEAGRAVWARLIEIYPDAENISPDPAWGENGAMDGVPPGYYVIVGSVNGERVRAELTVNAGQTSFVEIRTQQ
jgi:murein DD-endopeptidase MepM/ murein hydrolase activator NlpD